jgi:hypothetical protein
MVKIVQHKDGHRNIKSQSSGEGGLEEPDQTGQQGSLATSTNLNKQIKILYEGTVCVGA